MTLEEARRQLQAGLAEGTSCPCCGQTAKLYKRKLNSGMARALIEMCKLGSVGTDIDIREIDVRGGDYGKLRYWLFVEPGHETGTWRVTQAGWEFAHDRWWTAKHAFVYNGVVQGWSDERTKVREALGDHFDFDELWRT